MTLVRSASPLDVVVLPVPPALRLVLAYPDQRMATAEARGVLPSFIDRANVIAQIANVAAMTAAFANGDLELLGRACDDQIAEPARAGLLPGFREAKTAAPASGVLGGSISGAGPTSFYFVTDDRTGERVAAAVVESYARLGIACDARVTKPGTARRARTAGGCGGCVSSFWRKERRLPRAAVCGVRDGVAGTVRGHRMRHVHGAVTEIVHGFGSLKVAAQKRV